MRCGAAFVDDDPPMQLVPIPGTQLQSAWWAIAPFAEQMAERFPNEWPVPVIASAAAANELQLWSMWDEEAQQPLGCVGTRVIIKASGRRVLDIAWCAGDDRGRWLALLPVLEAHALKQGCEAVEFLGRRGWGPDLPDYRCRVMAAYSKDLTDVGTATVQ